MLSRQSVWPGQTEHHLQTASPHDWLWPPVAGVFAPTRQPADKARASAVGWYVTIYYLGGFVGSTVPAFLWHLGGWPVCVALIVAVLAASLLLVLTVWRRRETWRLKHAGLSADDWAG